MSSQSRSDKGNRQTESQQFELDLNTSAGLESESSRIVSDHRAALVRADESPDQRQTRYQLAPVERVIKLPYESEAERLKIERAASRIAKRFDLGPIASKVLASQGWGATKQLERYLNPDIDRDLPPASKLKNIDKAIEILSRAVHEGKRVAITCDYDVDGTSSGSIMKNVLSALGVEARVYAPDRFRDGYGLNEKMVQQIVDDGYDVLITLDFGTKNKKELDIAHAAGLETVVVDHHFKPQELPDPNIAFCNPKQPGCGYADEVLCTGGLTWIIARELVEQLKYSSNVRVASSAEKIDVDDLLGLATLATVADRVPLTGANRVLGHVGLSRIESTKNIGLKALMETVKRRDDIRGDDIGFRIGPMINAAGRIAREEEIGRPGALVVVELLTTDDAERAQELAAQLLDLNQERRSIERSMKNKAVELAEAQAAELGEKPSALVVWDTEFHEGVVGIVASRLVDMYHVPSIVMGVAEDGTLKGSARGIDGVHLANALEAIEKKGLIIKQGGHEKAAGLTIKHADFEAFLDAFRDEISRQVEGKDTTPYIRPNVEVTLAELVENGVEVFKELRMLEPTGEANPAAQLLIRNVMIAAMEDLGKNQEESLVYGEEPKKPLKDHNGHKRLELRQSIEGKDTYITGVWWHRSAHPKFVEEDTIDLVGEPTVDKRVLSEFDNRRRVMLHISGA